MIKLTGFIRDTVNPDNVIATIEYDINGEPQPSFNVDAPMTAIQPMTSDEKKDFIRGRVAVERGDALWNSIRGKLSNIVNVDLEA